MACCNHNHDCEEADCGPAYSLYKHIDLHKVRSGHPQTSAAPQCSAQCTTHTPLTHPHLWRHPAHTQIRCLNEDVDGSCKNVFKSWSQRTEPTEQPLRSDPDDCELLLHIP